MFSRPICIIRRFYVNLRSQQLSCAKGYGDGLEIHWDLPAQVQNARSFESSENVERKIINDYGPYCAISGNEPSSETLHYKSALIAR